MRNVDLINRADLPVSLVRHYDHELHGVCDHLYVKCKDVQEAPAVDIQSLIDGDTSDGYHTFNELYHHRAALFSVIVKVFSDKAWKALKHSDGSMFDGMFIVGIQTPEGQATYHYNIDPYWNMFQCQELDLAPEWDGHTSEQAIERIRSLEPIVQGQCNEQKLRHGRWIYERGGCMYCSECNGERDSRDRFDYCPYCGVKMDGGTEK